MGPIGEDSAPQQSTSDPEAGWKGGRPWVHSGSVLGSREPEDHKRVLRFQSTFNDSKFSFHAEPRQMLAT